MPKYHIHSGPFFYEMQSHRPSSCCCCYGNCAAGSKL